MDTMVVFWLCLLFANFRSGNCDNLTPDTEQFTVNGTTVSTKKIQPLQHDYDQCYVNVAVYNSMQYLYGVPNVTVTVLSRTKTEDSYNYTGYSRGQTDAFGRICLLVHCRQEGFIFAEQNSFKLFAAPKSDQLNYLPSYFKVDVIDIGKVIHFYSFVWGIIDGKTGPVYNNDEKQFCKNATSNDRHFVFSYISIPDKLFSTPSPPENSNPRDIDAWRYDPQTVGKGNTCYLKVLFETQMNKFILKVSSYLNNESGKLLGIYRTGVTADITSNNTASKYACAQFRCPVSDFNSSTMNTYVRGVISDQKGVATNECCLSVKTNNPVYFTNQTTFSATFIVGNAYGPDFGVYKADTQEKAMDRCLTSNNYIGDNIVVDTGFAMKYTCPCPFQSPIVG